MSNARPRKRRLTSTKFTNREQVEFEPALLERASNVTLIGKNYSRDDDESLKLLIEMVEDYDDFLNPDDPHSLHEEKVLNTFIKCIRTARNLKVFWAENHLRMLEQKAREEVEIQERFSKTDRVSIRSRGPRRLASLLEGIEEVWRECGGRGRGAYNDPLGQPRGPLLELTLEPFRQAGIPEERTPSRETLRNLILKRPRKATKALKPQSGNQTQE